MTFLILLLAFGVTTGDAGPLERVIYSFGSQVGDGSGPRNLIADASGNLYGTTVSGGGSNGCCGTVFQLSPPVPPSIQWSENVLYTFTGQQDGSAPNGTLVFDGNGNLYGAANGGGNFNSVCQDGCGVVFELTRPQSRGASWAESTVYAFNGGNDGAYPLSGVIVDTGNLYGTTALGGGFGACRVGSTSGCGTIFQLTPPGNPGGSWAETILYSFTGDTDGGFPEAPLVRDGNGNLYGTTFCGGVLNCDQSISAGTIFELSLSEGTWSESVIHAFADMANDGSSPQSAGLLLTDSGEIMGTTPAGGKYGFGTVYALQPSTGGGWTYGILYSFGQSTADGLQPEAAVTLISGSLYGTTTEGGLHSVGTAFQLTRIGSIWKETELYSFGAGANGAHAESALLLHNGALYGTNFNGGPSNSGSVYKFAP